MKDYTQRNFDKLCAALTMDELANFMDCLPMEKYGCFNFLYPISIQPLYPEDTLNYALKWHRTPQGSQYWSDVYERLELE